MGAATLLGHLSMNQTAEGCMPVAKGGHNRDVWEERILSQYSDPLHQLAVQCDMDLIRSYDRRIEIIDQKLAELARRIHGRDFSLLKTVPGIGRVQALTLLFEIDTGDRFPTVKNFCSYSRLIKGSAASAGKVKKPLRQQDGQCLSALGFRRGRRHLQAEPSATDTFRPTCTCT